MRSKAALVTSLLAGGALLLPPATAPGQTMMNSVGALLDEGRYDQIVTFSATVVRQLDTNEYLVGDGTGEVEVEAGPDWYHTVVLSVGEEVTVTGEVDFEGGRMEIDLFAVTLEDGQTIFIRNEERPPWASGPGDSWDDEEDWDDDEDWEGTPGAVQEIEGVVDSVNAAAGTFTIGSTVIVTTAATDIEFANGPDTTFASIAAGQRVDAYGNFQEDGTFLAVEVEIYGEGGGTPNPAPTPAPDPDPDPEPTPGAVQEIEGVVDSVNAAAGTFTIGSTVIVTTAATDIEFANGPDTTFASIAAGQRVDAYGNFQEDGTFLAVEVEIYGEGGGTPNPTPTPAPDPDPDPEPTLDCNEEIEGTVTAIDAATRSFTIGNTVTVRTNGSPEIEIERGPDVGFSQITVGDRVDVYGCLTGANEFIAEEVEIYRLAPRMGYAIAYEQVAQTRDEEAFSDSNGGWEVGGVEALFTVPVSGYNGAAGAVELSASDANTFGFWSVGTGVEARPGAVYRARFHVSAPGLGATETAPSFRARLNLSSFQAAGITVIEGIPGSQLAADADGAVYEVYLPVPPQAPTGNTVFAAFDILNFSSDSSPGAVLRLEHFTLEEISTTTSAR